MWLDLRSLWESASDVTVALTGQSLASSLGTLTPNTDVALAGQSGALSTGTLTPSTGVALSGQGLTFSLGTLTPNTDVPLSGLVLTLSTGSLTASGGDGGDVTIALTGSALTASLGTLTPNTSVPLAGSEIASSSSTLVPANAVPLSGRDLTFSAGTLTAVVTGDVTVALSGLSMTISASSLIASGGDSQDISGGWAFLNTYELQLARRRDAAKKRRELEEETEQIEDATDREIAQLLRVQEAKDDKRKDLEQLALLAKQNADLEAARQYSERVAEAYARVLEDGNREAIAALDRELQQAREEEEALLMQMFMAALE